MIWVISEVYYPEDAGTGHFMTLLAEGLAKRSPVRVLCGFPNYYKRGERVSRSELHHGVEISRCWSTTLDRNIFLCRLVNVMTASLSIFLQTLWHLKNGDKVLVVTNPPLLPFFVAWGCRIKGARCYLRIDDVYPEALIMAGVINANSLVASGFNALNRRLYRSVERIVVLGRDMKTAVETKLGENDPRIVFIPNWADNEEVRALPRAQSNLRRRLQLTDKFVVGYMGNIGPLQGIENLFACILQLRDVDDIHFLFVGSGKKEPWLAKAAAAAGLKNITLVGQRPRTEQVDFLNACDLGLVPLRSGMAGAGVPSRTYNIMAAGKPIIGVLDPGSEVATLILEEAIGWVVTPGDPGKLAEVILKARDNPALLLEMGTRARLAAEGKYSRDNIIKQYLNMLTV